MKVVPQEGRKSLRWNISRRNLFLLGVVQSCVEKAKRVPIIEDDKEGLIIEKVRQRQTFLTGKKQKVKFAHEN